MMTSSPGRCAATVIVLSFGCAGISAPTATSTNASTSSSVVQRFLGRKDEPLRSYRALRRLEAENVRYKKRGWMEAWTMLDAETGFRFQVVGEGGSGYIREKVLRKALEREAEAHARGETRSAVIVPANYRFAEEDRSDEELLSVAIEPRRSDPMLIRGRILLRADDADLVRIEGQLAKRPSFWTRRVDVVRRYARVSGVRVPLGIESVAQLIVAGRATFHMKYDYAMVNGRDVGNPQPRRAESSEAP